MLNMRYVTVKSQNIIMSIWVAREMLLQRPVFILLNEIIGAFKCLPLGIFSMLGQFVTSKMPPFTGYDSICFTWSVSGLSADTLVLLFTISNFRFRNNTIANSNSVVITKNNEMAR